MATPQSTDPLGENLELSVEELLTRAKLHPPYGEPVVVDTDVLAVHQRQHDADCWIASNAIRLGIPPVSNDGVFHHTPDLILETLPTKS